MHQYNQSLAYDQRMFAADVKGSIAFSKALQKAGIVSETEQAEIERGLRVVEQEWKDGKVRHPSFANSPLCIADSQARSGSSTSKRTTRTSILPMNVDCRRSLARILEASFTRAEAGTIKLRPT